MLECNVVNTLIYTVTLHSLIHTDHIVSVVIFLSDGLVLLLKVSTPVILLRPE